MEGQNSLTAVAYVQSTIGLDATVANFLIGQTDRQLVLVAANDSLLNGVINHHGLTKLFVPGATRAIAWEAGLAVVDAEQVWLLNAPFKLHVDRGVSLPDGALAGVPDDYRLKVDGDEIRLTGDLHRYGIDVGMRRVVIPTFPRETPSMVSSHGFLVRKSELAKLGGFDVGLKVGEDVDLSLRAAASGVTIDWVGADLATVLLEEEDAASRAALAGRYLGDRINWFTGRTDLVERVAKYDFDVYVSTQPWLKMAAHRGCLRGRSVGVVCSAAAFGRLDPFLMRSRDVLIGVGTEVTNLIRCDWVVTDRWSDVDHLLNLGYQDQQIIGPSAVVVRNEQHRFDYRITQYDTMSWGEDTAIAALRFAVHGEAASIYAVSDYKLLDAPKEVKWILS